MNFSRRKFLVQSTVSAAALAAFPSRLLFADAPAAPAMTPQAALHRLMEGNKRFAEGHATARNTAARRGELTAGQGPFAIVLSCSDSRVPPETVFDAGLGELFVVRIAGNILDDDGLASIEYAVANLGSTLIYVLGHESCGAVKAALEVRQKNAVLPGHLPGLVAPIFPAVDKAIAAHPADLLAACIHNNVVNIMQRAGNAGPVVGPMVQKGSVMVAGGVYQLGSGKVEQVKA